MMNNNIIIIFILINLFGYLQLYTWEEHVSMVYNITAIVLFLCLQKMFYFEKI